MIQNFFMCDNSCISIAIIFFNNFLAKYFFVIMLEGSQLTIRSYLSIEDKFLLVTNFSLKYLFLDKLFSNILSPLKS